MVTLNRTSVTTVAPATEPVSIYEVKDHLAIAIDDHAMDTQLNRLIPAAREVWEHDTQTLVVSRSVIENLTTFPGTGWRFYYSPVESVSSITYYDTDGTQQTLNSLSYSVDLPNRQIYQSVDYTWPDHQSRWDAVQVNYSGGNSVLPEIAKSAVLLQISMLFGDDTISREYTNWETAYNNLVLRYQRSSYP